ncbi:MAG: LexA family protein, partial [Aristaeellaceae bacterium]
LDFLSRCCIQGYPKYNKFDWILVQIDGATDQPDDTIKRVYRKGHQVELRSDNPEFDPMIYPADDVQVAGVLIDVLPYGC